MTRRVYSIPSASQRESAARRDHTAEKIEQRVAHDLFYTENRSMPCDLRIPPPTPLPLVAVKNAY
jgi:lipopolysaccharide/colanic/teichoic acid biosynthesis glycosyltransferase